jgi:hypothetical protein
MNQQTVSFTQYRRSVEDLRRDLPLIAEAFDRQLDLIDYRLRALETTPAGSGGERNWIIRIGVILGAIAVLFPPFYYQFGASRFGLGHEFILSPPHIGATSNQLGSIDGLGLLAILAGIALVTWGASLVRWKR